MAKFTFQNLKNLFLEVNKYLQEMRDKYPQEIHCQAGCTECCTPPLNLTTVEAVYLQEGLKKMSKPLREELLRLCREPDLTLCPLLIEEKCSVYEYRPLHCQIHGFPAYHEKQQNPGDALVLSCGKNFTTLLQAGKLAKNEILELDNLGGILNEINRRFCEDFFSKGYNSEQSLSVMQALLTNFGVKNPAVEVLEATSHKPAAAALTPQTVAAPAEAPQQPEVKLKLTPIMDKARQEAGEQSALPWARKFYPAYHTASRTYYHRHAAFKPVRLEILTLDEYKSGLPATDKPCNLRFVYGWAESPDALAAWKEHLTKNRPAAGVILGVPKAAFSAADAARDLSALEKLLSQTPEFKDELQELEHQTISHFKSLVKNYLHCANFAWYHKAETLEFSASSRDEFINDALESVYPKHPKIKIRINPKAFKPATEILLAKHNIVLSKEKWSELEKVWQVLLEEKLLTVKESAGRLALLQVNPELPSDSAFYPVWEVLQGGAKKIIGADKYHKLKASPWGLGPDWGMLLLAVFLQPFKTELRLTPDALLKKWSDEQEISYALPEPPKPAAHPVETPADTPEIRFSDDAILLQALHPFGKDQDYNLLLKKVESWFKALSPAIKTEQLSPQTRTFLEVLSAPDPLDLKILEDLPNRWDMKPCEDWSANELESFTWKIAFAKLETETAKLKSFFPLPAKGEKKAHLQAWLKELIKDFKLSKEDKDTLILEIMESALW